MTYFARYKTAFYCVLSLLVGVAAFFAYETGMCFGYRDITTYSEGFGSSHRGVSLGSTNFYLRKGQTLTIAYDAQIRRGYLHIHLINKSAPFLKGTTKSEWIRSSSKGEVHVPIHESAWYVLVLSGSPDGRGYELDYTASWSAK